MTIGIEGISFQKNPGGIGKYLLALLVALVDRYPQAKIICYSNKSVYLPDDLGKRIIVRDNHLFSKYLPSTIWLKLMAGFTIRKDKPDYYISGAGLLPGIGKRTKILSILHDLNHLIVPQTMGVLHMLALRLFLKKDAKKSNYVVTNSKGTADKLLEAFGIKASTIINPPTSHGYKKLSSKDYMPVLEKYGLKQPFFLAVGTLEPRKNVVRTINAFLSFKHDRNNHNYTLVLVGGKGWKDKSILKTCDENKGSVNRLGYVDEADLPALYNASSAFLFPSLYEGFGMPAREAYLCETAIITSDLPEIREACYNCAIFIDPNDTNALVKALHQVDDGLYPSFDKKNSCGDCLESFLEYFQPNVLY